MSDSDDDLLPNINSFNAMFTKVQQQARKVVPRERASGSKKLSKSMASTSENKRHEPADKKDKRSECLKHSKKKKPEDDISDDMKHFLEEIDDITNPTDSISPTSSAETTQPKSRVPLVQGTSTTQVTASSTRSRRGRKKRIENDDSLMTENSSFDSCNQSDVVDVPSEHCTLMIRWKEKVERFRVPEDTKMSRIKVDIADRVSARVDSLVIMDEHGEEIQNDIIVGSIPFGKTLEAFEREREISQSNKTGKTLDPDSILIKLQGCGGYRQRYSIAIKKTTPVKQLVDDYVEKFELHGKNFKLVFDGEDIDLSETPESLDLESNDMIDIVQI